ncbi:uncharacterized protein JN550_002655 [Neoarthrinium moseri]|uniref:uncharacterized protein n=1 Tax=Neoarthrinium moseri TaxID=1658444 RepID=UPI001FDC5FF2|nr:uncharacterized protein JN550_002655 [Neoarthrinium moseri]KAI1874076.1 hypothetical protein JN550_002655 [Neoarthrinium moseri]
MRLLETHLDGIPRLTKELNSNIPPYAILSHTWGEDEDEVSLNDVRNGTGAQKLGYHKIRSDYTGLFEAINSMFHWYQKSAKCYVYLADVPSRDHAQGYISTTPWDAAFLKSRWFTRGWTFQELLAPASVEFFLSDHQRLGDRSSLAYQVHGVTRIPFQALAGASLSDFTEQNDKKAIRKIYKDQATRIGDRLPKAEEHLVDFWKDKPAPSTPYVAQGSQMSARSGLGVQEAVDSYEEKKNKGAKFSKEEHDLVKSLQDSIKAAKAFKSFRNPMDEAVGGEDETDSWTETEWETGAETQS